MIDGSCYQKRGILGCSVMSAHSCSDNVLGVLKTLHGCNSVTSYELWLWHMIALGMIDESRRIIRVLDRWFGADSSSDNVHGVLRTLHDCNSVNIMS